MPESVPKDLLNTVVRWGLVRGVRMEQEFMETITLEAGEAVRQLKSAIADAVVMQQVCAHPDIKRTSKMPCQHRVQEVQDMVAYLVEAVAAEDGALFLDYVQWAKVVRCRRGLSAKELLGDLAALEQVLRALLPEDLQHPALAIVQRALHRFPQMPENLLTWIGSPSLLNTLARGYLDALLRGDRSCASELVFGALERGMSVQDICLRVFQPVQYEIGRLWQTNQIDVAQEHYCTALTQVLMAQLYPRILSANRRGNVFVGLCVAGELHELGMRMVTDFLEMEGWSTWYLGASTPALSVVQLVANRQARLLGISATLTPHLPEVTRLIQTVRSSPGCAQVKILVGGYPFKLSPKLWKSVGADGFAFDAESAVEKAWELVS